jgi:type II secretion system protein N
MKPLFTNKIGRTARLLTGRGSLLPACVLAFLLALLVGFGFGFPSDVLRQRLVQELSVRTGLAVSSDSLELSFPAKLSFDLTIDPHQEQIVPLVFKPLQLQPVWSTLFSAGRAAVLSGRFAGGDIAAQLGADQQLQLDIRGVQLGPLQKPANPYRLDGVLSGTFDARQISRPGSVDALFSAEVGNLQLFGLEPLGLPEPLALGKLSLQGIIKGQRLSLEKVALDGNFAALSGSGTLQLGANPRQTRLNLRVIMTPGATFPASLQPLIELSGVKPKPDGSYQFRIAGTLAVPILR